MMPRTTRASSRPQTQVQKNENALPSTRQIKNAQSGGNGQSKPLQQKVNAVRSQRTALGDLSNKQPVVVHIFIVIYSTFSPSWPKRVQRDQ